MFTTDSHAFATGRKRLMMNHIRVCCRPNPRPDEASATNAGAISATETLKVEELVISKDTVHTIVHDDFRFVPQKQTDEQKAK